MKKLLWFLAGVVGGFAAAHVLNKDPRGHELLAAVDSSLEAFADRLTGAYRAEDARRGDAA